VFDITIVAQTVIYRTRHLHRVFVSIKPLAVVNIVAEDEEKAPGLRGDAPVESVESLSRRMTSSARTVS
jgi:hypothetical protein